MKYWPVPDSYTKKIPDKNLPGSFWENRQDRYHCGIDIYAPDGSDVISIDNGYVVKTGIFTKSTTVPYWNQTRYIIIKNTKDLLYNYAELGDVVVKKGEYVNAGQLIGHVGTVLNINKVTIKSPKYIQKIKNNKHQSMLHFEIYNNLPSSNKKYSGGNWFGKNKPSYLLNPANHLKKIF